MREAALFAVALLFAAACDQDVHLFDGVLPGQTTRGTPRPGAPNVVLITLDSTRADALGAYGQSLGATPSLDLLAQEGVVFEQCSTAAPDTLASHAAILTGQWPFSNGVLNRHAPALSPERRSVAELVYAAGHSTGAEIAAPVLGRITQLGRGFEHLRDVASPDVNWITLGADQSPTGEALVLEERDAEQITERGIEFLIDHRTTPFFLWLHYFDPHVPYNAPARYRALQPTSPYHAELMYVDNQVGRLIDTLRRLELSGNTLVVVVGDHGEGLGEHGEETHGLFVNESTVRVPLILWGAEDLVPGRRVRSVTRTIDVAPTILDFLELPGLDEAEGVSLLPLAEGRTEDLQLTAYGEAQARQAYFDASALRFVRRGPWKYVHGPDPALFDLDADPGEQRDLALQQPERVAELRIALEEMLADAPALRPRPAQVVDPETREKLRTLGLLTGAESTSGAVGTDPLATRGPNTETLRRDFAKLIAAEQSIRLLDFEAAATTYRALLERYPESPPLLVDLINSLRTVEQEDEVIRLLWRLLSLDPGHITAQTELARVLASRGDAEALERLLRISIVVDPCAHVATSSLYELLNARQAYSEAVALLREAVDVCEASDYLLNNYAWALATIPDAELRDGLQAVDIAKRVASRSHPANPAYLDTLAAAYAEVELFETAIKVQQQAIEIMERAGAPEEAITVFRLHLELFENNSPIRE